MCKMKGCVRPGFVGGLCGFHALEAWSGPNRPARRPPSTPGLAPTPTLPRRRVVARPASG
jgi:hypothetical protein